MAICIAILDFITIKGYDVVSVVTNECRNAQGENEQGKKDSQDYFHMCLK